MATLEQVDSFHEFAVEQIRSGRDQFSMEDLFYLWQSQSVSPEELSESVPAIQEALAAMESGDRGVPLEEWLEAFRERRGIKSKK